MAKKKDVTSSETQNQISADELLSKLKENLGEEETAESYAPKKYKFKKEKKEDTANLEKAVDSDYKFESPVPKSNIEGLDVDALMKMYLPEEDYNKMNAKKEDPFSVTIDSTEFSSDENTSPADYQAPDSEMYDELNAGGKVCDVPELGVKRPTDTLDMLVDDIDGKTADIKENTADDTDVKVAEVNNGTEIITDSDGDETISADDLGKYLYTHDIHAVTADDLDDIFSDIPVANIEIPEIAEKPEEIPTPEPEPEKAEEEDSADFDKTVIVPVKEKEEPAEESFDSFEETMESERTAPSDTDTNIMIALGMDDELSSAYGEEDAEKLLNANEEVSSHLNDKKTESEEFTNSAETKKIITDYKKKFLRNSISIFGVSVFTILLFFYENIISFGGSLPSALDPDYYPTVNIMAGLQILFLSFVFAIPYLIRGTKALVKKQPTAESILPLVLVLNVIFAFVSMTFASGTVYRSYFLPASVAVLAVVFSRRLDLKRERLSFRIVSSKRNKFALEKVNITDAELETEAFNSYLSESTDVFRIKKARFVDGYFRRTEAYPTYKKKILVFLGGIVLSGFIAFIIGLIKGGGFSSGLISGYSACMFSIPASIALIYSYPAFRRSKNAYNEGTAYIGEAVSDEYSTAAFVSFDDREAFPTGGVKIQNIECIGENASMDGAICYAACIYRRIGGPLADVLNVTTAEITLSENVDIVSTEKNGIAAAIDGKNVLLGSYAFIRGRGVEIDEGEYDSELAGSKSIFYIAVDGEAYCRFYVKYSLDPEFYSLVKSLYNSGVCIGIKTMDPNINDDMLGKRFDLNKFPIRILNYGSIDERVVESDRIDSGIISKRSAKALLRAFGACDKFRHSTIPGFVISGVAIFVGFLFVALFTIFGSITSVTSVWPTLLQLFWLIPSLIWVRLVSIDNE